jgi:hypothetical protein
MTFNPSEHLTKIKTKNGMQDYLKVQYRLVWFRDAAPDGTIETELVHLDTEKQIAVFKATVTRNGAVAMGHGSETAKDFMDYIEKAETKAIGRALAALGYGTQFTGDELDEGERIVDTPVATSGNGHQESVQPASNGHAEPAIPTVKELQKRCNDFFGIGYWQSMLHKALKVPESSGPIPDSAMTIDWRQKTSTYLDFVQEQKAKGAA